MKSGKIGQVVLEKKRFKDFMVLYLYIAQGQRQITTWWWGWGCGGKEGAGKNLILTKTFYYFNNTL